MENAELMERMENTELIENREKAAFRQPKPTSALTDITARAQWWVRNPTNVCDA